MYIIASYTYYHSTDFDILPCMKIMKLNYACMQWYGLVEMFTCHVCTSVAIHTYVYTYVLHI